MRRSEKFDIESLIRDDYKIFVDTCSFMHPKAEYYFFKILAPLLIQYNSKIIIPKRVAEEVIKHQNSTIEKTKILANAAYKISKEYQSHGILEILGEENDPFADCVFLYVFLRYITKYNLALITQDVNLALDILSLSDLKSVNQKKLIAAVKLHKYRDGEIIPWSLNKSHE